MPRRIETKKAVKLPRHVPIEFRWRYLGYFAAFCLLLPVFVMSVIWAEDRYRNGSLYAMCDDLPVGREFVPLKREIFMDGCYTESACPPREFRVSQVLAHYEITSLTHCLDDRPLRPDQAIRRAFMRMNSKPAPVIEPVEPDPEQQLIAAIE